MRDTIVCVFRLFCLALCAALPLGARGDDSATSFRMSRVSLDGAVSFEMLLIEPGTFTIGSPADEKGRKDIESQHAIKITKPFYLGKCEVTQALWEYVMTRKLDTTGFLWKLSNPTDVTCDPRPSRFPGADRPVENVSWRQCKEFIARLNALVEGGGFRLPTEAEWEYAARAGTATAYTFGNDGSVLGDFAWWKSNSGGETHPVGAKKANPWGLFDMQGNVWEWCADVFDEGPYNFAAGGGPIDDYRTIGAEGGSRYQVIRGGSYAFSERFCRSAVRSGFDPWQTNCDVGFRLARDAAPAVVYPKP